MRIYYYLLFRLFDYYIRERKEDSGASLYFTITSSTVIVYLILYTFLSYVDFYFFDVLDCIIQGPKSIILILVSLGLLNYYFFVKPKRFLEYNFKADRKGGYIIIGLLVLKVICFVFIANKNREKIFKAREQARIEKNE